MPETVGQYMTAELAPRQPESGKTKRWLIRNRDCHVVGAVGWHGPWRRCVFEPHSQGKLILDAICLRDIAGFLERQNAAQKAGR